MYRTDDPDRDFAMWDREEQSWLDSLPKCDFCGEPIQDYYFDLCGDKYCEKCMDEHRKAV